MIPNNQNVYSRLDSPIFNSVVAAVGVTSLTVSCDVCAARVFDSGEADCAYVDARRLGLSPSVEQTLQEWPRKPDSVFEFSRQAQLTNSTFRPQKWLEDSSLNGERYLGLTDTRCKIVDCFCLAFPLNDHTWVMFAYLRCGNSAAFSPDEMQLLEQIKPAITRTIRNGYNCQLRLTQQAIAQNGGTSPPHLGTDEMITRLSRTERHILQYLFTPATERQIAQSIHRSPHTVHVHVKNIYRKLGINSRRQLQVLKAP